MTSQSIAVLLIIIGAAFHYYPRPLTAQVKNLQDWFAVDFNWEAFVFLFVVFSTFHLFYSAVRVHKKRLGVVQGLVDSQESLIEEYTEAKRQKMILSCDKGGCKVTDDSQVYFYRVAVEVDCIYPITKCVGYLNSIESIGKSKWDHETLTLPFAPAGAKDDTSLTLTRGNVRFLDVLTVGHVNEVIVASKPPKRPRTKDHKTWIIAEPGNYFLYIHVCGEAQGKTASLNAKLRFHWTGKYDTAEIYLEEIL